MKIQENVKLAQYTTYKIGGPARWFVEVKSEDDIREALAWAHDNNVDYFILGGGSNLLISDDGYPGLVIFLQTTNYKLVPSSDPSAKTPASTSRRRGESASAEAKAEGGQTNNIVVDAGIPLQELVNIAIEHGLAGLEWAAGIPGTLGGAVRGNAGAFGGEMKDNIVSVRALTPIIHKLPSNPRGHLVVEARTFTAEECEFSYRSSIFKDEPKYIILSAEFSFQKGDRKALQDLRDEKINLRETKHPLQYGTCGSVFKRVDIREVAKELFRQYPDMKEAIRDNQVATAYFIDKCGLKGKRVGGAEISTDHPNFVINRSGKASARDVIMLIDTIKDCVKEKFNISLEEEMQYMK